jgi:hypothetical protein
MALSLEMFERDVQGIMDEYLSGVITERDLKQVCHQNLQSFVICLRALCHLDNSHKGVMNIAGWSTMAQL